MINTTEIFKEKGLHLTTMPDGPSYLWRLLTLKEYKVFTAMRIGLGLPEMYVFLEVFKHCYQGDFNLLSDRTPLGYLCSIGELILWLSGDCNKETIFNDIEAVRQIINPLELTEFMKTTILAAFESITPYDIDNLNRNEFFEWFVRAENLLQFKIPDYKPIDLKEAVTNNTDKKTRRQFVNFQEDNAAFSSVGAIDRDELLNRQLDAQFSSKNKKLSKDQAKKLNALTGG